MSVPPTGAQVALEGVRFAASVLYLIVGSIVVRRDVDRDGRIAQYAIALWWFGLGIIGFVAIPFGLGVRIEDAGLTAVRLVGYTVFPLWFFTFGGLCYYLLYIYTGRRGLWLPVLLYYTALVLTAVYLFESGHPYIALNEAGEREVLTRTEAPAWFGVLFAFALLVPPLLAAFGLFALFFKVPDRLRKYRVALISGGITLWFVYSLGSTTLNTAHGGLVDNAINQTLGLLAATLVYLAYIPPRRWHARLLHDPTPSA